MFDNTYEAFFQSTGELQVRLPETCLAKLAAGEIVGVHYEQWPFHLENLLLAVDLLANTLGREVDLFLPYLPYARTDRRFPADDYHRLNAFMRAIASAPVRSVHTVDAPSQAAVEQWPNFLVNHLPVRELMDAILCELYTNPMLYVLFPTPAAAQRYFQPLNKALLDIRRGEMMPEKRRQSVIIATGLAKIDPETKQLIGYSIPELPQPGSVLLIDDICDTGKTFIEISRQLRKRYPMRRISAYATHGVFSEGTDVLRTQGAVNGTIYTTDTWTDIGDGGAEPFGREETVVVLPAAKRISAEIANRILRISDGDLRCAQ